jgi:hypothetical protein
MPVILFQRCFVSPRSYIFWRLTCNTATYISSCLNVCDGPSYITLLIYKGKAVPVLN